MWTGKQRSLANTVGALWDMLKNRGVVRVVGNMVPTKCCRRDFFLGKLLSKEKDLGQILPDANYHELNYSCWLSGQSCSAYEKVMKEILATENGFSCLYLLLLTEGQRKVEHLDHTVYCQSSGQMLINDLSQYPCECCIHSNKPW